VDYPQLDLIIGGRRIRDRDTLLVLDPATGERLGDLPVATAADLDDAITAAVAAFPAWRRTPAAQRARILSGAAALLRQRADAIGRVITREQGKPVAEAVQEVHGAAGILEWFAEEGRRSYGRVVPASQPGVRHLVLPEPVGPVAAFTPWNFPITIPARKIGGALAAGCPIVIKPAEETPATTLALAGALLEAGLPEGVLSMVFGDPAAVSEHLIRSEGIRKVTFTGSTAIGRRIAALAAEGVKRVTLELGGHAPVLVFDDADLARAVALSAAAKFRNAGQVCISPTRFLVQETVYHEFGKRFAEVARHIKVGNGLEPGVGMGPLAHERRPPMIESFVQDAIDTGATVVAGGHGLDGCFWEPTVLSGVAPAARTMIEEPFGPLALIAPFRDLDDAVRQANDVRYGLASYAFTGSLRTAHELSESVEAGMLGINQMVLTGPETPFGGTKESGYGSEGGSEGLADYQYAKLVSQS
jgi:succinate-semialdehyde dehydrogenase/glutarate-semialdehyde dehydrogenase